MDSLVDILPQSVRDGNKTVIDELRLRIKSLEAESQDKQFVYDELVAEMKAKLLQRISEVEGGLEIQPFADVQAASLATDQKVQALTKSHNEA
jgi:hypothetical protein